MKLIISFLLFAVALTVSASAGRADDVIFQKQLADQKTLIVSRGEGQFTPPTPETRDQFPDLIFLSSTPPDHVYIYDFVLHSKNQGDKLLWSYPVYRNNSYDPLCEKFQVYDAAIEEGSLIITWKDEGVVCADVINPDAQNSSQGMPWEDTQIEGTAAGFVITGADIEGSIKHGTLAVVTTSVDTLKKLDEVHSRFFWKEGQWIYDGIVQIYQKQLPDQQSLIVTRTQVPYPKPTPQQIADNIKWMKDHPGRVVFGSHRDYLFTYILTSADGKKRKVLWTTKTNILDVEMLDVAVEDSATLIVLEGNSCNIIQPGPHGSRIELAWRETMLPASVSRPVSGLDGYVIGGKIIGSLKSNDLQVQLTSATDKHFLYRWQNNKWQFIPEETPSAGTPESQNKPISP